MLAAYRDAADLVEVGAYAAGSNPRVDRALRCHAALLAFLRQAPDERCALDDALAQLGRALASATEPARA
jgi:flagellar biosynthesis/type III secretory pathway ATPase